jgi:hypothetical protein
MSGPFSDKAEKLTNLLSCFSSCNTKKQHKLLETITIDLDEKRGEKNTINIWTRGSHFTPRSRQGRASTEGRRRAVFLPDLLQERRARAHDGRR